MFLAIDRLLTYLDLDCTHEIDVYFPIRNELVRINQRVSVVVKLQSLQLLDSQAAQLSLVFLQFRCARCHLSGSTLLRTRRYHVGQRGNHGLQLREVLLHGHQRRAGDAMLVR